MRVSVYILSHFTLSLVHKQTVSWLTSAPSVLKDCLSALSSPDDLRSLLQHHKCLENLGTQGKPDVDFK